MRAFIPVPRPRLLAGLALSLLAFCSARAADDKPAEPRVPAAQFVTETASLLRREGPGKPWQVVKADETLLTGDLLLGGASGGLDSANGAVRLVTVGDVDGRAPLPIHETAFVLHEAKDVDLDLTLERGRIRLINLKKQGAARVRVRVGEKGGGEVTLTEPGATLSVELYGRWPRGVPFRKEPKAGEAPTLLFALLAIKGEVDLKSPRRQLRLKAPPGPALLEGDTLEDAEPAAVFLRTLPLWAPEHLADLGSTERGKHALAVMHEGRQVAAAKGLNAGLEGLLTSDDPIARRHGVVLLAATDNFDRLSDLLKTTTHQDVWDAAIVAMRNWIGRGPGQDQILYKRLIEQRKYSPAEAEGLLQLLHSFGEADLAQPETLQALVSYLGSDQTSLRELAYWHLSRLVPPGKKIGYDPLGPKEKRDAAVKEWRKLVVPAPSPPDRP